MRQQQFNGGMHPQTGRYYQQWQQGLQQQHQGWNTNGFKYGGKENKCINQFFDKYMNSLDPIYPISLSDNKPRVGHTKYGYTAATIIREIAFTSENLQNWAILDSGASSHFILSVEAVLNKMVADKVTLPNDDIVRSSHIAELDIPPLPSAGRAAHIVPGLASHSLVSVVKLCNTGCEVDIKDISSEIWYQGKTKGQCSKDVRTGLWMMPLINSHRVDPTIQTPTTSE